MVLWDTGYSLSRLHTVPRRGPCDVHAHTATHAHPLAHASETKLAPASIHCKYAKELLAIPSWDVLIVPSVLRIAGTAQLTSLSFHHTSCFIHLQSILSSPTSGPPAALLVCFSVGERECSHRLGLGAVQCNRQAVLKVPAAFPPRCCRTPTKS
jgi:hypothetical protein